MKRVALLPLSIIMMAVILTACQMPAAVPPTAVPPTDTQLPTPLPPTRNPTTTITPTSTPTATPSPTPFAPFEAVINTEIVNLRSNPGFLFPVLRVIQSGDKVSILGKTPDGIWFRIRTKDSIEGWVYIWLLSSDVDLQQAPVMEPKDVLQIHGRVRDQSGTPMYGIEFTVDRSSKPNTLQHPIDSGIGGEFFVYMPISATGTWFVSFSGLSCISNVWKDTNCISYKDGYQGIVEPNSKTVTLPSTDILEFTWK